MRNFRSLGWIAGLVALLAFVIVPPALAGNTVLFSSQKGDLVFPLTPPLSNGTAGAIDNMAVGATTPAPGSFTTLGATGAITGQTTVRGASLLGPWGTYAKNPASLTSYPSYSMGNDQAEIIFTTATTISYAYITLAPAPLDGMRQCYFSPGAITTLYVYANVGQTIANAATALSANVRNCYTYSTSGTKWDRSQ